MGILLLYAFFCVSRSKRKYFEVLKYGEKFVVDVSFYGYKKRRAILPVIFYQNQIYPDWEGMGEYIEYQWEE